MRITLYAVNKNQLNNVSRKFFCEVHKVNKLHLKALSALIQQQHNILITKTCAKNDYRSFSDAMFSIRRLRTNITKALSH